MERERLKYFRCDAEKLYGLVEVLFGHKLENDGRNKKIFMELVEDIYRGVSIEVATCALFSLRWPLVCRIVDFGRGHGIPKDDWIAVMEKKFQRSE
jgi:hypothetical protein